MKTNFKYIKTVAAIFLALVIYSCHDELIEQQDVSNTNQEFSKKPKKYCGSFVAGDYNPETVTNLLISSVPGNSSNASTIQWQPGCTNPETCDKIFNIDFKDNGYDPNYQVQISFFSKRGEIAGFQIWMLNQDGTHKFSTGNTSLVDDNISPMTLSDGTVIIEMNKEDVELFRNIKGQGKIKKELIGYITIGSLVYNLKTLEQDCWEN